MDNKTECLLENSLCKTCFYYIFREIKPFEDAREQWEEEFDIELTEDSIIETHSCMLMNIDLDHIVYKCSKYMTKEQAGFTNNLRLFK